MIPETSSIVPLATWLDRRRGRSFALPESPDSFSRISPAAAFSRCIVKYRIAWHTSLTELSLSLSLAPSIYLGFAVLYPLTERNAEEKDFEDLAKFAAAWVERCRYILNTFTVASATRLPTSFFQGSTAWRVIALRSITLFVPAVPASYVTP